jgi:hypothetical protein
MLLWNKSDMPVFAELNIGPLFLLILVGCLALVWLCALIDCLRRNDFSRREKIAWVIVILFTNYFGLIAYFVFFNRDKRKLASRYPKVLDPITGKPCDDAPLRSHH